MAYQIDPSNGDIVISGFQNGIGDSPYSGPTDMRNVNIISVPGEATVNFATSNTASSSSTGAVVSASGTVATYTGGSGLEGHMAIYFTSAASYSGFTIATPYWVGNVTASTFTLFSDYAQTTPVTITGSGTAPFFAYQMGILPQFLGGGGNPNAGANGLNGIQYFAAPTNIQQGAYSTFGVDAIGMVWSNQQTTTTHSYWTYTGNKITDSTNFPDTGTINGSGNGLAYWRVSNGGVVSSLTTADYLFVFRNSQIDFYVVQSSGSGAPSTGVWTYGWAPSTIGGIVAGTTGNTNYLTVPAGTNGSHCAIVGPDNRVYYCDGCNIVKISQVASTTIFNPTSAASFVGTPFNLLPVDDIAQCIAPLGTNMLIGGQQQVVYMWNTTSNLSSYYILIAEAFVSQIISVNTNAYIFAGNRGRIYITNGSQAQLWKKFPDFLTGTIEPKYLWAGATSIKNQLYFSFNCFTNAGNALANPLGAVWAYDLDSQALRAVNELSYGTYSGYASAMIPQVYNPVKPNNPGGTGLYIGWYSGSTSTNGTCGIDQPSTSIYTSGQAYVVSELIPVGTCLEPTTPLQYEFKLSAPLVVGESVELQATNSILGTFISLGTTSGDATGKVLSGIWPNKLDPSQWVLLKAILTGTNNSNQSFNRLMQLRIKGATLKQTAMFNTK